MLDGLYPYEVVILSAGAILFVVLIWAFVFQIRSGSLGPSLVMFFMIDIAMIGFPAFNEFQYKDGVITLEKQAAELQNEPTNPALRSSLEKTLEGVLPRTLSGRANPDGLVSVATAQYELGEEADAKNTLKRALWENRPSPEALEVKQKIESVDRVRELTAKLNADPADSKNSADLRAAVQQVSNLKLANPNAIETVARAQESLGKHKAAAASNEMAKAIFGSKNASATAAANPSGAPANAETRTTSPRPVTGVLRPTSGRAKQSTVTPHH